MDPRGPPRRRRVRHARNGVVGQLELAVPLPIEEDLRVGRSAVVPPTAAPMRILTTGRFFWVQECDWAAPAPHRTH